MAAITRQCTMSKDPQLEQDIERNLRLRDGASRILSIAVNSIQRLDAAKTMLVSNARLLVSMRQLQHEKFLEANISTASNSTSNTMSTPEPPLFGKAKLCLSDIRIPLLWRALTPSSTITLNKLCELNIPNAHNAQNMALRSLSINNGGNNDPSNPSANSYTAFCIVKVGNQIQETRLLCDIAPGTSDVEFEDVLSFDNVNADFRCIIELYAYPKAPSARNSFLRRKSSMGASAGFRKNSSLSPEETRDPDSNQETSIMGAASTSTCFALVARYIARLADVGDEVIAHTLQTANSVSYEKIDLSSNVIPSLSRENSLKIPSPPYLAGVPTASARQFDESCELPLFGPICFRLAAQPHSLERTLQRGFLWIRALNVAPEQEVAQLYVCELSNQHLLARLMGPAERRNLLHTNAEFLSCPLRKKAASVGVRKRIENLKLRNPTKWDLILKIDPSAELLDSMPTLRVILLSSAALVDVSSENNDSVRMPHVSGEPISCESQLEVVDSSISDTSEEQNKNNASFRPVDNVTPDGAFSTTNMTTVPASSQRNKVLNSLSNDSDSGLCSDFFVRKRRSLDEMQNRSNTMAMKSSTKSMDLLPFESPVPILCLASLPSSLGGESPFNKRFSLGSTSMETYPLASDQALLPSSSVHIKNASAVNNAEVLRDTSPSSSNLSRLEAVSRTLFTVHIAARSIKNAANVSKSSLSDERRGKNLELTTVFELAAFEDATLDPQTLIDNEQSSIRSWYDAIKSHLDEQIKWGVNAFDQSVVIPEATSFTKHGSIIRGSAFLDSLYVSDPPVAAATCPVSDADPLQIPLSFH